MYNKNKIKIEIEKNHKKLKPEKTFTVYFIDTDDYDTSPYDNELNKKIEIYCKANDYYLVWFCKNIENVFLHQNISDNYKISAAKKFLNSNSINYIDCNDLSREQYAVGTSNILVILDKILSRI